MTLLITLFAAVVATLVWYTKPALRDLKVGVLCWMFWGASRYDQRRLPRVRSRCISTRDLDSYRFSIRSKRNSKSCFNKEIILTKFHFQRSHRYIVPVGGISFYPPVGLKPS